LHFFNADVYKVWEKTRATAKEPLRSHLPVITDFEPSTTTTAPAVDAEGEEDGPKLPSWGIHALPVDYVPMKDYVSKGREVFRFEREGHCVVCKEYMPPGEGVYALCANDGCEGVGHLSCWSRHMIPPREWQDNLIPVDGRCPKCSGEIHWADMMRELTLRTRGSKEVDKLLKKKRVPKTKAKATSAVTATA
jgi:structure-specific endonuclease subunit SLX1